MGKGDIQDRYKLMKTIQGKSFKDLTTFGIGGKIKHYVEVSSEDEIRDVSKFAKDKKLDIFVLGGGSDILVSDKEFDGLVVHYKKADINLSNENGKYLLSVCSGAIWDSVVEYTVAKNLQGIECLSGIPGFSGAAPIQNIGAYGQEIKDVFVSLKAYNFQEDKFEDFDKNMCEFGYRESVFKTSKYWQKYLITEMTLELKKNYPPFVEYESLKKYLSEKSITAPTLGEVREAVLQIRSGKFENPRETGNAGSFFKNPIIENSKATELMENFPDIKLRELPDGKYKSFAAWFVEKSGWKGKTLGGAGVSSQHALILINKSGSATSSDVFDLSEAIIKDVSAKFGITLEREVQLINF